MTFTATQLNDLFLENLLAQLAPSLRPEIVQRYQAAAPVLLDRLQRLYGDSKGYAQWLQRLSLTAGALLATRSTELKTLDSHRSENPTWFMQQDALGYCAYVDRFGGTLAGIKEKIAHLQELGVTYLHLLPFLQMRPGENDGGFAVENFHAIEPALGNMDDLRDLTVQLRQVGISLCSDFVLNHVANTHPWAQAAMQGDAAARDLFYTYTDRTIPDEFEKTLVQIFPQAAPGNFTYEAALQRWVWTTFYPYQWDLNYANPEVFLAMISALLNLSNHGVEVFRLDSAAFLWKRAGTNGMNQPEVHWLLQAMRALVDIVAPGVLLKAEAIVPTAELPSYVGIGAHAASECHLAYHSTLMASAWAAIAEQDTRLVRAVINATPELAGARSWMTYVRCHDDIGWNVLRPEAGSDSEFASARLAKMSAFFYDGSSFARGVSFQSSDAVSVPGTNGMTAALAGFSSADSAAEIHLAKQRMLLLFGLAFCFGGLPLIYMGDEFAQTNASDYLDDPARLADSRWAQRPALDNHAYAARHDASTQAGELFQALTLMTRQRRRLPQLAATAARTLLDIGGSEILAFARGTLSESTIGASDVLLYVANFSARPQAIDLTRISDNIPARCWIDVLSGKLVDQQTVVSAWSQLWLIPQNATQPSSEGAPT